MNARESTELKLARLMRYALSRVKTSEGPDAEKWRRVFHLALQVLRGVLTGAIPRERLAALDGLIDSGTGKVIFSVKTLDNSSNSATIKLRNPHTDGKEGDKGRGEWVTINGTHVQIGKSGQVEKGPPNLVGKAVPTSKEGVSSGNISNSQTGNARSEKVAEKSGQREFSFANCHRVIKESAELDVHALYESAKSGKRHGGIYRDAMKKSQIRLEKSISSHTSQVEEHADKISHPMNYDIGWEQKDTRQKEGLLRKWEKDLKRNAEQAAIEMEIWKERFENDN